MTNNVDIINAAVALIVKAVAAVPLEGPNAGWINNALKYEWLKRVALIKGIDHLTELCKEFEVCYNNWRPHMTLDGLRPDDVFYNNKPEKPERDAKTVPTNIEQHFFKLTRITGYRLKKVA